MLMTGLFVLVVINFAIWIWSLFDPEINMEQVDRTMFYDATNFSLLVSSVSFWSKLYKSPEQVLAK
jgi:PIN domain nuclease of toxin-antitoxin system